MNWTALAAIAEILAAAGVIISLVYLAGQVRSSAKQARQTAIQSVVNKMNDVWTSLSASSTADVWVRGSKGLAQLNGETEGVQFSGFMLSVFKPYEEIYHYWSDGRVDDWTWESISTVCHNLLSTPGVAEWWERRSAWFSAEFQEHIGEVQQTSPEYRRFGR
jgi:hypothetical protein